MQWIITTYKPKYPVGFLDCSVYKLVFYGETAVGYSYPFTLFGEKGINWKGWILSLSNNNLNEKKIKTNKQKLKNLQTPLGEETGRGCSPVPSDTPWSCSVSQAVCTQ